MQYRPEIDGLRSIAIVAVILFHLRLPWIPGGFLGVDVFFVISGFLITSIILRDLEQGAFRFRDFWARRVRRIVPAMLAVTFGTVVIVYYFGFKGLHPEVGAQALATLISVANLYFFKQTSDYWGPEAESSVFLHAWSLSVEEQFYLALPLLLFLLHRKLPKAIFATILFTGLISLGVFLWGIDTHPTATFYLLPTRAWELAFGAALASLPWDRFTPSPKYGPLATGGIFLIFIGYALVPELNSAVVIPVLGTVLFLAFGQTGICGTILRTGLVVYVGRISYSLYLWHWPVIVLPKKLSVEISPGPAILIMVVLAIASYHLIEQTTRRAKYTVPIALSILAFLTFASFLLSQSSGTYDTSRFNKVSYHGFFFDLKPNNFDEIRIEGARAKMFLPPRQAPQDAYKFGGIISGPKKATPSLVVLGDSHGLMWSNVIRETTNRLGITASFYSMDGVSPFFEVPPNKNQRLRFLSSDVKYEFDLARIEYIQRWQPEVVIISSRWSILKETLKAKKTIEFLSKHSKQILLIGQPPVLTFGNRFAVEQLCFLDVFPDNHSMFYMPTGQRDEFRQGKEIALALAEAYDNVNFVPVEDIYAKEDKSLALVGANVVYLDDDHLTDYGSGLAANRIFLAIRNAYNSTKSGAGIN